MARKPKKSKQAPISTHPVFPAIVALWFAALFGVGSLVLPAVLFEKLFAATGLASLTSALAAPIAPTARIAIAVVSALIGVGLGIFLARKVAASHADQTVPSASRGQSSREAKKPISAMEELGVEGLDEPIDEFEELVREPIPGRRRALSVTDDSGPSEFLENAPLPGGLEVHAFAEEEQGFGADSDGLEDTLELGEYEEDGDRGWGDEHARVRSFGSGSLSSASDVPATAAGRPDITRQEEPEEAQDSSRPFDGPSQAPAAHPAPFAPPPAAKPAPVQTAVGGPRPFDAPGSGQANAAQPEFSVQESITVSPASTSEAQVGTFAQQDEPADPESPIDELRRHFDAPAPKEADTEIELTSEPEDDSPPSEDIKPRLAFGMPTPVEEETPVQQLDFSMPQQASSVLEAEALPVALPSTPAAEVENAPTAVEPVSAEPRVATASLSDLGMVELVERFALSLQRKGDSAGSMTAAPALAAGLERLVSQTNIDQPPVATSQVEEAKPDAAPQVPEHMQPLANPEPAAPQVPAALQPIGIEDEDDADVSIDDSFSLPFQRPQAVEELPHAAEEQACADTSEETDEGEDEGPVPSEGFGSLLAMKSPFGGGREFVRIEDEGDDEGDEIEPVVVFPGNEARHAAPAVDGPSRDPESSPRFEKRVDSDATERALREALVKLQKLSGAA